MVNRDVIVIGASAGGVEALRALVFGLPKDLPATVLVVLHLPEGGHSALPAILGRAGCLSAFHPPDGHQLRRGEILVAPPNHHLTVLDGRVHLTHGPRENGHRPAVDTLFRTAARWHGARVIGVVLSGALDDGTAGQVAIAAEGGLIVVQDPDEAIYPGMIRSVMEHVAVDHVAPAAELGRLLDRLTREGLGSAARSSPSPLLRQEAAVVDLQNPTAPELPGDPAGLGCPQCGGSLFMIKEGTLVRYRCRVGHAWSPESLLAEQSDALESALWMALRTLEDRAALSRRCERSAEERGHGGLAERYRVQAAEAESASRVMRRALEKAQHATRETAAGLADEVVPSASGET